MNQSKNEFLPSILNVTAGIAVFLISFLVKIRVPIDIRVAKSLGILMVFVGIALVIWSAMHIKEAFFGEVEPKLDVLIKTGPYRFVRHPVYLGMTIALTGIPVAMRSCYGLIGVFLLFLPSEIYRAKLEEKALKGKFGSEWEAYAARTGFMLPSVIK
jgi:protein-S-isoprenylcysteine O-methyltransferase Ste14